MVSLADVGVWENYINAPTHIHKTRWVNLFIPQPISNQFQNVSVVVCFYIVHSNWLSNRERFIGVPRGVI